MARITVEDCLDHVENRFELVLVSARRARQLALGVKEPKLAWENDKPTVVALREIEEGFVDASILEEKVESDDFMDLEMLEETSAAAPELAEQEEQPEQPPSEPSDKS